MQQQTIPVNPTANIWIGSVPGDLRVAGWDRPEIMVKAAGDTLQVTAETDPIVITSDEALILYLPRGINLNVEKVSGDALLQALTGSVTLGPVAGDLTLNDLGAITMETISGDVNLRNVGAVNCGTIDGDFTLRSGHGICAVDSIGGDGSIRDVDGMLTVEHVNADLYVRNVQGAVTVNAGGDVALYLTPLAGQVYDVSAGDSLTLHLPPDSNVSLHLSASSPDSIQVDFPGVEIPEDCNSCEVTLGQKTEGMVEMVLTAGDDLLVTSQADRWESAADFDSGEWRVPPIPPLPPLSPEFSERINRRVRASMERAQVHIEAAGRKAESAGRKAEAAMRRAEAKVRAAEVRSRSWQGKVVVGGRTMVNFSGPVVPRGDPVSDDERLAILKMLQEKKISLEQAEQLLAALEGK
jgi:hypothetical protein